MSSRLVLLQLRLLSRVVPDLRFEQLAIGEDDLLSRLAADASCLQPDVLYFAAVVLDGDRIAHDERLVDHYRDRGEEIAEDVLNGERDGKTADAKRCEEPFNL